MLFFTIIGYGIIVNIDGEKSTINCVFFSLINRIFCKYSVNLYVQ